MSSLIHYSPNKIKSPHQGKILNPLRGFKSLTQAHGDLHSLARLCKSSLLVFRVVANDGDGETPFRVRSHSKQIAQDRGPPTLLDSPKTPTPNHLRSFLLSTACLRSPKLLPSRSYPFCKSLIIYVPLLWKFPSFFFFFF